MAQRFFAFVSPIWVDGSDDLDDFYFVCFFLRLLFCCVVVLGIFVVFAVSGGHEDPQGVGGLVCLSMEKNPSSQGE